MKEKLPLVTVVTATYNNFSHIENTINSVLTQDYPHIEYIITDDGSASFPLNLIENILSNNMQKNYTYRIMNGRTNVGTVRNLNRAYKFASGDYIINLSCGDVFYNNSVVTNIVNRFILNDSDVIATTRIVYSNDFEPAFLLPHYYDRQKIDEAKTGIEQYKLLILGTFYDMASGSAMSYSKRILNQLNYLDEKYILWEDGPFLSKFLQNNKIDCAYDIISIWYETGGVSSNKPSNKKNKLYYDTLKFNSSERMMRLDLFNSKEIRLIKLQNYLFKYRYSVLRHLFKILYFDSYIILRNYKKNREMHINEDASIIKSIK